MNSFIDDEAVEVSDESEEEEIESKLIINFIIGFQFFSYGLYLQIFALGSFDEDTSLADESSAHASQSDE